MITVSPEDVILFEQNGFTENDIKESVYHHRANGLSDDEIQGKINNRIAEFKKTSQNQKAFNSTLELDRNNNYVKTGDYDLDRLSASFFTPEELKEIDSKGPVGWWELAKKTDKTERLPFSGDIETGVKATKLNIISDKLEKGEEISQADRQFLNNYMRDYIEVSRRGTTWGAKVTDVILDMPAWMVEIGGISLVTGGFGSIPATAKKVAAKSGSKAALNYTTKALIKSAKKAGTKGAVLNAAKANAVLAPKVYANYAQRRISDGIAITDKGEAYLKEVEEKPAITVLKALADTNIEAGTELIAGQYLNLGGALVANSSAGKAAAKGFIKAFDLLPKKTRVALESAARKLRPNDNIDSLFKSGGFNGVLEEMGEERVADILKTTLDLDPEEGYSADQFMKAINPGADELLVELGAFAIMGGISRSGSIMYNNLRSRGVSDADAKNAINNLSEIEKDNWVNDEVVKDNYSVNSDITEKDVQEYDATLNDGAVTLKGKVEYNAQQAKPEQYFSDTNYTISNTQKEVYKNYSNIIEKIIQNRKNYNGQIELGETPQILQEAGLEALPLETSSTIINKMQKKKGHNLKSRTLKALPYLLNNPIAVFSSNTQDNSVIVLLNATDKKGLPVMLAIEKNNTKGINEVNFITSGYGRKQNFFSRLLKEGKLIKIRKNNIPAWLQESLDSNNSVSDNHNSVNAIPNRATNSITDNAVNINPNSTELKQSELTSEQEYENEKNNYQEYKKVKKYETSIINKALAPISTELDVINPKLKHALRRYEMETGLKENEYAKEIKPFYDKVQKMSNEDYGIYDLALKNGNTKIIEYLNSKYNMTAEFGNVRKLLDTLYDEAKAVGMDIGKLDNYFPRKVINPAKFLDEISKDSFIRKAIRELDLDNTMTQEEKAQAVNNLLRGYGNKVTLGGSSFTKERRVEKITPELNQYYKDSMDTLADYIKGMNENIQARKFFGKGENVEKSVGAYAKELADEGLISPSQEQRVKELLMARFTQRGVSNSLLAGYRDISYMTTMGNFISAITQLGDNAFTLYKNGAYDSFIGFAQSFTKNHITRADLGIDRIAQEFSEESKTSKAVKEVFKINLIDAMDKMSKETFINASYRRIKRLAKKPTKEFDEMLNNIFGEEAEQVKEDLKNDYVSRNVKYLLFSDLSDFQPISLSEMPQLYLTSGNGRILYMLKTYTIKQLDIYRNECFRKMKDNPVEGLRNLIRLSACLVLCNATADSIKNLLLGRPFDLEDMVIDNLLRLVGFSKWQVYKARREGLFTTLLQSILPPVNIIDDLIKDSLDIKDGKYPYEKPVTDLNSIKDIPIAGKLYYWWFGKGSKTEEKSGAYRKFSNAYNKAKKANDVLKDLDGDMYESYYSKNEKKLANYQLLKGYNNQIQKLKKQRKQLEESGDRESIKNINDQIDETAKAGLEAIKD